MLAVCGDGGFMMNSQEVETAIRLRLNLVVLILDDGAYGMIRWKQAVDTFPDFGLTFDNPNFVRYAEAYGARGVARRADRRPGPDARGGLCGGWRAPGRHYRTPVAGLYFCGPGTHSGGGVSCAPGRNAAMRIIADLRGRRAARQVTVQGRNGRSSDTALGR
ncbi:thiamine pyrophosphate-dependent enzyme [Virgifigura deserti]|uniref:thiamine pyrophosphate-dependent enzyme n=1 Tax=Virgifigura deserti TaxID=2268457 RepID=UPI003CCBEB30